MPGGKHVSETRESVRFQVATLREAAEQIKRLQGTGQLVINYANGRPSGLAEWKPGGKGQRP